MPVYRFKQWLNWPTNKTVAHALAWADISGWRAFRSWLEHFLACGFGTLWLLGIPLNTEIRGSVKSQVRNEKCRSVSNIVLIVSDQQRWDSIGANGNCFVHTPNLDERWLTMALRLKRLHPLSRLHTGARDVVDRPRP